MLCRYQSEMSKKSVNKTAICNGMKFQKMKEGELTSYPISQTYVDLLSATISNCNTL